MADVLDLSFCPLKSIDEVSNLFLSLCLGRRWFSNEVDDLKKAQGSEEVRQVVELVFVGCTCETIEIVCCITQAIKKEEELSIAASKLEVRSLKEPL